eukprot:1366409-Amphidinium_carterae.1
MHVPDKGQCEKQFGTELSRVVIKDYQKERSCMSCLLLRWESSCQFNQLKTCCPHNFQIDRRVQKGETQRERLHATD